MSKSPGQMQDISGQSILKDLIPKMVFVIVVVTAAAVVTSRSNQADIKRIEERGTMQAQKNTERIVVLESLIATQTQMMQEMRLDIKVLLGRSKE